MTDGTFAVLALLVLGWAITSGLLSRANINGPLLFTTAGYLLANPDWGPLSVAYEATSIHDLTDAMGINPPSLYAAFGDKEHLYLAAVERYQEWRREQITRSKPAVPGAAVPQRPYVASDPSRSRTDCSRPRPRPISPGPCPGRRARPGG